MAEASARRWRMPPRRLAGVVVLLVLTAAGFVALGSDAGLPWGPWLFPGAVGSLQLAAASVVAARPARHRTPPRPDRIAASGALLWLLWPAVVLLVVGLGGMGLCLVLDPAASATRRGGAGGGLVLLFLVAVNIAWLGSRALGTPRPRLDLTAEGLRYRGGRTDRSAAWPDVRSVALADGAQRLVVRVRDGAPIRVPVLLFDIVPSALVTAIEDARRRHRR